MGYRFNRLDEPVLIAVSKPLLTEFGIHHRLESCEYISLFWATPARFAFLVYWIIFWWFMAQYDALSKMVHP